MKTPAPADLHRWSEELARNPASLAFLPLARAYRRLGRRDLAVQLCLRGLEHHPTHVEAHALLALLYFEAGERAKAADEWATVLRLKPGNFEALRGMGFRYLEQGDIGKARLHLERAALIRPDDATVQEALRLIRHRETATAGPQRPGAGTAAGPGGAAGRAAPPPRFEPAAPAERGATPAAGPGGAAPPSRPEPAARPAATRPWAEPRFMPQPPGGPATSPPPPPARPERFEPAAAGPGAPGSPGAPGFPGAPAEVGAGAAAPGAPAAPAGPARPVEARPAARAPQAAPPPAAPPAHAEPSRPAAPPPAPVDPAEVFGSMGAGPLLGVLLLDRRGLVLAGSFRDGAAERAEELGGVMGAVMDEAIRTVTHLGLGGWRGLMIETQPATLHVAPVGGDALVVVAAERGAPTGWILRTAAHAASLAERFMGVPS